MVGPLVLHDDFALFADNLNGVGLSCRASRGDFVCLLFRVAGVKHISPELRFGERRGRVGVDSVYPEPSDGKPVDDIFLAFLGGLRRKEQGGFRKSVPWIGQGIPVPQAWLAQPLHSALPHSQGRRHFGDIQVFPFVTGRGGSGYYNVNIQVY